MLSTLLLCLLCFIACCDAFYLPGVAPHEYEVEENIKVKVNKLDSVFTQLPYDYYSLPFCHPNDGVKKDAENLGEILSGDKIESSPFAVKMGIPQDCKPMCKKSYVKKHLFHFSQKIEEKYRVNLYVHALLCLTLLLGCVVLCCMCDIYICVTYLAWCDYLCAAYATCSSTLVAHVVHGARVRQL